MTNNKKKSDTKGKVYIRINGGLGNQMFQWAFARRMQEATDMDIILDLSFFEKSYSANRPYMLKIFEFEPQIVKDEWTKFKLDTIWQCRKIFPIEKLFGMKLFNEAHFQFDTSINTITTNTYIDGYFQTEKYFKHIEPQIREDFTFAFPPSTVNSEIIEKMHDKNSISIHIRRGDYVNKARYNKTYSHCSIEYYKKAVSYIAEKYPNPEIFVFSDDIKWVKENLNLKYPCHYIAHNTGKHSWEDLRLMSNCKHNVIANSSFSWWGAWLNNNPEKIVVAPQKWFQDEKIIQTDIIPADWVKMDN